MNRKHIALEFVEKYGDKLTQEQRLALSKLGSKIVKEDLDRNEILKHKKKMQSLITHFFAKK